MPFQAPAHRPAVSRRQLLLVERRSRFEHARYDLVGDLQAKGFGPRPRWRCRLGYR